MHAAHMKRHGVHVPSASLRSSLLAALPAQPPSWCACPCVRACMHACMIACCCPVVFQAQRPHTGGHRLTRAAAGPVRLPGTPAQATPANLMKRWWSAIAQHRPCPSHLCAVACRATINLTLAEHIEFRMVSRTVIATALHACTNDDSSTQGHCAAVVLQGAALHTLRVLHTGTTATVLAKNVRKSNLQQFQEDRAHVVARLSRCAKAGPKREAGVAPQQHQQHTTYPRGTSPLVARGGCRGCRALPLHCVLSSVLRIGPLCINAALPGERCGSAHCAAPRAAALETRPT